VGKLEIIHAKRGDLGDLGILALTSNNNQEDTKTPLLVRHSLLNSKAESNLLMVITLLSINSLLMSCMSKMFTGDGI